MAEQSGHSFAEEEVFVPADRPSDAFVFQHLGAAVVLCWARLPLGAREQILIQAGDVIGFAPAARQDIVKLLLRHAKAQWTAAISVGKKA